MTLIVVALHLVAAGPMALMVAAVGLVATLLESLLGAVAQDRLPGLTNEMVNGLQTAAGAIIAMGFWRLIQ